MSKLQCELIRYVDEASRLATRPLRRWTFRGHPGEVIGLLSEDAASADLKETLCFYNQLQLKLGSLLSMEEALEESSSALLAECEARGERLRTTNGGGGNGGELRMYPD